MHIVSENHIYYVTLYWSEDAQPSVKSIELITVKLWIWFRDLGMFFFCSWASPFIWRCPCSLSCRNNLRRHLWKTVSFLRAASLLRRRDIGMHGWQQVFHTTSMSIFVLQRGNIYVKTFGHSWRRRVIFSLYARVFICICMFVCVCVCVHICARLFLSPWVQECRVFVCACLYVFVCALKRR